MRRSNVDSLRSLFAFVPGVVLVVTCSSEADPSRVPGLGGVGIQVGAEAAAQVASPGCRQWQVKGVRFAYYREVTETPPLGVEAGWEPFDTGLGANDYLVFLRRCAE